MLTNKPKHILIAPLDWGLGHTTRCVPLIRHILGLGHTVTVAANASQRSFIEETFGRIDIIHLDGYNISYSKWNEWAQVGLLSQLPSINNAIIAEHKWLQQLCAERKIDGIISDNRYGLFHEHIPSVILTHQLQVQSGFGRAADRIVQNIHYKLLNRFDTTWIPDNAGVPNLGGKLSHSGKMPRKSAYIGLLSRFAGMDPMLESEDAESHRPLVILLSGPEPGRSILSRLLWQQSLGYNGKVVFIEGNENAITPTAIPAHIEHYKRLANERLLPILLQAGMVICRSGYSTLMDLMPLGKKAILIPTPGQTEQQYLADHLHKEGIFYSAKQRGFEMETALKEAKLFPYNSMGLHSSFCVFEDVLRQWLGTL